MLGEPSWCLRERGKTQSELDPAAAGGRGGQRASLRQGPTSSNAGRPNSGITASPPGVTLTELLAVLCAVFTFPDILFGRQALFFIDNTQALSSAIHGYTRNLDCAPLSNLLYLSLAALQVTPWFDFVPSKANCADLPSREEGDEERVFLR